MKHNNGANTRHLLDRCHVGNPSVRLQEAIADDSNYVSDWLWYAKQVASDAERRYCFERILYINPDYPVALDALRALNMKEARQRSDAPLLHPGWRYRLWLLFGQ